MNATDVAYALNLDLDAISKRLHDPDYGPHLQDVDTILFALHSLQEELRAPGARAGHDAIQAIHADHRRARTPG